MEPVLEARGVSKRFGGVQALRNADLAIYPGSVHCLVGENGSGKSTLVKILSGAERPDAGSIRLDGTDLSAFAPREAIQAGIQVIHQDLSLFPNLSVAENIAVAPFIAQGRRLYTPREATRAALAAMDQVHISLDPAAKVADLPASSRQLTAICRSLAQEARVIFMDEPTTALTWHEVQSLFEVIHRLAGHGVAVVFVSHKFNEILEVAEHITVLRNGEVAVSGAVADFDRASLSRAMTGHEVAVLDRAALPESVGPPVLELSCLNLPGSFEDISFAVAKGEIVGLTGLLGSGHVEVGEALFGLQPGVTGEIRVDGRKRRIHSVVDAIRYGIGYIPGDRLTQGTFLEQSVARNLVAASIDRLPRRRGVIERATIRAIARHLIERLAIKVPSPETPVRHLSGGHQQRVVVGKWLQREPHVLVINGPTVGVDIGSRREILSLLQELSHQATSIVLLSDDIPELVEVCHRVLVMRGGKMVAELQGARVTEDAILQEMVAA